MQTPINNQNTVIISCGALITHVNAAQEKMGTSFPVVELDTGLHSVPENMRRAVSEAIDSLSGEVETVLMSMGLCGGSLSDLAFSHKTVIPRVDDCITMLMETGDRWHFDLKTPAHLYVTDTVDNELSVENIKQRLIDQYGEKKGMKVFHIWFAPFTHVDIIDTGVYDSYSPAYLEKASHNASLIDCPLYHVKGSNVILEKLVSGRWDEQFMIAEKGQSFTQEGFGGLE